MGASFVSVGGSIALVALPFLFPLGYFVAVLRHSPGMAFVIVIAVTLLATFFWIRRQLLRPEVLNAQSDAGICPARIKLAAALGAVPPLVVVIAVGWMFHGETAKEAIRRAHQQLSGNYQYVVTSMQKNSTPTETDVVAVVVAYNRTELRRIFVKRKQQPPLMQ